VPAGTCGSRPEATKHTALSAAHPRAEQMSTVHHEGTCKLDIQGDMQIEMKMEM
jgi:hypothetical protein